MTLRRSLVQRSSKVSQWLLTEMTSRLFPVVRVKVIPSTFEFIWMRLFISVTGHFTLGLDVKPFHQTWSFRQTFLSYYFELKGSRDYAVGTEKLPSDFSCILAGLVISAVALDHSSESVYSHLAPAAWRHHGGSRDNACMSGSRPCRPNRHCAS